MEDKTEPEGATPFEATAIQWYLNEELEAELAKPRNKKRKEMLNKALVICTGCAGNIEREFGEVDDQARLRILKCVFHTWSFIEDAFHPHPDQRLRFYGKVGCRCGAMVMHPETGKVDVAKARQPGEEAAEEDGGLSKMHPLFQIAAKQAQEKLAQEKGPHADDDGGPDERT